MAADPAAQRQFLKDHVDADFIFLLEEHGVELALQYAIGQHYKSIRMFAAFADDRAAARTAISADFGVRAESAADRARMACIITAWEASRLIREEEAKLRAEAKEPASEYLAHKLEQIENGEPTASYLDEVALSKRSSASDPPPPEWPRVGKGTKGGKGGKEGTKDGKGKSTGKIQVGDAWYDLVSKTPDGRELCYAYNIKRGCHVKGCQRVHACRVKGCQGGHPAYQHGAQGGS
eukprot:s1232_g8.t2